MSDYKNRDDIIMEIKRFKGYLDDDMTTRLTIAIDRIPSADVEPVRHSVWRVASADPDKEYECMNCKKAVGWKYLYCPNCGARMDGEEQDHE